MADRYDGSRTGRGIADRQQTQLELNKPLQPASRLEPESSRPYLCGRTHRIWRQLQLQHQSWTRRTSNWSGCQLRNHRRRNAYFRPNHFERFPVRLHTSHWRPYSIRCWATSPALYGISGVPNCLSSVPYTGGGTKCGTPGVSVTGYSNFSNGGMLYEPATTFHFSDNVSKLVGKHSIKAGAQFDHYSIDNYQPNGVNGAFSFNGNETGNGFADFLFGAMANSSLQVQNAFVSSRAWSYSFFVQDDFKLSPKLTLNLGLRWQYDQSFHETHHGDAFFDPCAIFYSGKDSSCVPHWEQFGVNGTPDTTLDPSKHQFEPRIGIAWNPSGGFVVRAGYGIMHPGYVGHGRAGDGQPGPNLLATTTFVAGTSWDSPLPSVVSPDPSAITAPIPINTNVSFQSWAPRNQYPTYTQLWNLTVQKQFGTNTVAQIGYVGSKGTHLPINYAYNICQQTPASAAAEGNPFDFVGPSSSPYCPAAAAAVNAGAGFNAVYCCLTINPGWWGTFSELNLPFPAGAIRSSLL